MEQPYQPLRRDDCVRRQWATEQVLSISSAIDRIRSAAAPPRLTHAAPYLLLSFELRRAKLPDGTEP